MILNPLGIRTKIIKKCSQNIKTQKKSSKNISKTIQKHIKRRA
jgi:hypothetical protein